MPFVFDILRINLVSFLDLVAPVIPARVGAERCQELRVSLHLDLTHAYILVVFDHKPLPADISLVASHGNDLAFGPHF